MYAFLGRLASRRALAVVAAWIALVVGLRMAAPSWSEVALDGDFDYLPAELPSVRGQGLLHEAFDRDETRSQIILVFARDGEPLDSFDYDAIEDVADRFRDEATREELGVLPAVAGQDSDPGVWTPDASIIGDQLVSATEEAALVLLKLRQEFAATKNIEVMRRVESMLDEARAELPEGLEVGVSGSAAVGGDMLIAAAESLRSTETVTVLLVLGILLLVYRAPLLTAIPLITIAASVVASLAVISLLASIGMQPGFEWWSFRIFTTTRVFVVVLLFGAGTDFCFFLIARYREELAAGAERDAALENTLSRVGDALMASAMTTILGLGTMYFADFGKFRNSGPAIGLCLAISLCACLTLAPALLRVLGGAAFWPFSPTPQGARDAAIDGRPHGMLERFWARLAGVILARPGFILVASLILLSPAAWSGMSVDVSYDLVSDLPRHAPTVAGTQMLRDHFDAGETGPLTVLVLREGGRLDSDESKQEHIPRLTKLFYQYHGVSRVRSLAEPLGGTPGNYGISTDLVRKLMLREHPYTQAHFLTDSDAWQGRIARFDLILEYDPFSQEAIDIVRDVQRRLGEGAADGLDETGFWDEAEFYYAGATASISDLQRVTQEDQARIQRLVVLAVFAVILFILRRPAVCVFLIASVLFSYLVTLGVCNWFFHAYFGDAFNGFDWKMPLFLFVILVAVGQDYNIYLATRVFEEQRRHGQMEGIRRAIYKTGATISSCGLIMAGTFSSMTSSDLRGMFEMGFALSFGVMLDTFYVRPILVPAFLALLSSRRAEESPERLEAPSAFDREPPPADAVDGEPPRVESRRPVKLPEGD